MSKKETVTKVMPPKPDEADFKKRLDAVAEKIDAKKLTIKEITQKIDGMSQGKAEYETKKAELYERMNATKAAQTEVMAAKKELREAEFQLKQSKRTQDQELKRLDKDSSSNNEEAIRNDIHRMEMKIQTETMTIKEEKLILKAIKERKQKIPEAKKLAAEYEHAKAQSAASATLVSDPSKSSVEQLQELENQITKLKEQQTKEFNDIQELKKTREGKISGVKTEIEQKKKIKEEIDTLNEERNKVWEEKKAMQKTFNVWEKEQRLEKQRKWDEERARQDAEWEAEKARKELEKPNPWLAETMLLEQTVEYLRNMMPTEASAEVEKKEVDHSSFGGAKVMLSKKDREEEMYLACSKKKNLKQKANKKAASIKHTADTFAIFDKLKVAAPMSTDDLKPLMDGLQKTLDGLNAKTNTWEAERKEKLAEVEAAEPKVVVAEPKVVAA